MVESHIGINDVVSNDVKISASYKEAIMVESVKEPTDLAPVSLTPGVVADHSEVFAQLWHGLDWERRGSTPAGNTM